MTAPLPGLSPASGPEPDPGAAWPAGAVRPAAAPGPPPTGTAPTGTAPGDTAPAGTEPAAARGVPRHRGYRPRPSTALVAVDTAGVLAGGWAGGVAAVTTLAAAAAVLAGALRKGPLYRPGFAPATLADLPALAAHCAIAWAAAAALAAAPPPPRLAAAAAATVLAAAALRALLYRHRRTAARRAPGSALIVGAGPPVRAIAAALHAHPEYGMRPVGVVTAGPGTGTADPAVRLLAAALHAQAPADPPDVPLPVLTGHAEITRAVIQNAVRHAVVVGPPVLDPRTTATVRLLAAQGACVWQADPAPGARRGPVPAGHLWGFACRRLDVEPYGVPRPALRAKRAMDAGLAGLALLLLAPVLGGCALAVRLCDGPGVIFRQERIGLGGRPFTLLKFRTLPPRNAHEAATRWSIAGDRRMSAVGRLLRRTSLDELPQLWNVLRGDMSLVGPRPERPHFVAQFSALYPGYQDRHRMPAGITGLAQVHGLRGDTSIADRARFDNHYIDTWSVWQDVAILVRTAGSVFRFGGS